MLHQEVNLYHYFKAPPPIQSFLSWRIFWLLAIIPFLLFFIQFIISISDILLLKNENRRLIQKEIQLEQKFVTLKKSYPPLFFSQNTNRLILQLQRDIENQEQFLQMLTEQTSFSSDFLLLTQITPESIWLTDILISKNGNEVTLKGHGLTMQILQDFMNSLLKNKRFENYSLDLKNVKPLQSEDNISLQFEVTIAKLK